MNKTGKILTILIPLALITTIGATMMDVNNTINETALNNSTETTEITENTTATEEKETTEDKETIQERESIAIEETRTTESNPTIETTEIPISPTTQNTENKQKRQPSCVIYNHEDRPKMIAP